MSGGQHIISLDVNVLTDSKEFLLSTVGGGFI